VTAHAGIFLRNGELNRFDFIVRYYLLLISVATINIFNTLKIEDSPHQAEENTLAVSVQEF